MNTSSQAAAQKILWDLSSSTTLDQVKQAIAAGADVNAGEAQTDRTPLMILIEEMDGRSANTRDVMKCLLDAGADPLGGDCAFHRAISQGERWQVEMIVDEALEQDLHGDFGETIFHVFAQMVHDGEQATMLLRAIERARQHGKASCIHEVDEAGNSPLHTLWREGYCIDLEDFDITEPQDEAIGAHWYATVELWKASCQLDIPNNEGQTVSSLIQSQLDRGFAEAEVDADQENFQRAFMASVAHSELSAKAAAAGRHNKPRRV